MSGVEVEGKLIVVAERPAEALVAVAAIDSLDEYALAASGTHEIRDVYYDTPGRELATRRLALRLRDEDGQQKLTLKQESEPLDDVRSRPELELAWSPQALRRVVELIRNEGVPLPAMPSSAGLDAAEAMKSLGLQPFSSRRVERKARAVRDASGRVVAETAIDAVTFLVNGVEVRHFEIECEAKGPGDAETVQSILDRLKQRFAFLQLFEYSKLDIAEGLERLAVDSRLAEYLDHGVLKPTAYDEIRTALQQTGPST